MKQYGILSSLLQMVWSIMGEREFVSKGIGAGGEGESENLK